MNTTRQKELHSAPFCFVHPCHYRMTNSS
ncbi:hypothetical protein D046_1759A, partial [Vibrio parahaemolyticus V-223/04]